MIERCGRLIHQPSLSRWLDLSNRERRSPLATETAWLSGPVVKDALDLLHRLWRKLLEQLERFHVVVDLVRLRGAEDDGADVWILDAPGDCELADVAAHLLGDLGELRCVLVWVKKASGRLSTYLANLLDLRLALL